MNSLPLTTGAPDRGLRIADKRGFPVNRAKWLATRDEIHAQIMSLGYNRTIGAFVQHYGSEELDASVLIMPLVFLVLSTERCMLSTLDQIRERLVSDSLVRRYRIGNAAPDGLQGQEGTFNLCTFWLVEALTRAGRLSETRLLFEKMLSYANHLGFYAEQLSLAGERLRNFPQAITHMGFISAAYNLNMALEKGIETGWGGTEMPHVCRTPKAMQRPVPIHLACDQGEMAPSTELRRGKEQAHA